MVVCIKPQENMNFKFNLKRHVLNIIYFLTALKYAQVFLKPLLWRHLANRMSTGV